MLEIRLQNIHGYLVDPQREQQPISMFPDKETGSDLYILYGLMSKF